jgi:hypothetical protein
MCATCLRAILLRNWNQSTNEKGSPCEGLRSAVVTRVDYWMGSPFFWRLYRARRRNGEIPGVKTSGLNPSSPCGAGPSGRRIDAKRIQIAGLLSYVPPGRVQTQAKSWYLFSVVSLSPRPLLGIEPVCRMEEGYMEKASGGTFARATRNTDEDDRRHVGRDWLKSQSSPFSFSGLKVLLLVKKNVLTSNGTSYTPSTSK